MPKLDFSYTIAKFIDPVLTLILYASLAVLFVLLAFLFYGIIKLRINPFNLTKSSIRRLKRMEIRIKILDFIRWLILDAMYHPKNMKDFDLFGFTVFCGRQGAGKTISMINYANWVYRRFPDCIIVANFDYKYATYKMTDWRDLIKIKNGKKGVLFLIDEIHSEYNSGSWKDFPEDILSEISQQRKQRIKICATSQVYSRIVKQIREQCFSVVQCQTVKGRWTFNREYDARDYEIFCDSADRKRKLRPIHKTSFVQSDELRRCYDTYEKIERMKRSDFIPRNERTA